MIRRFRNLDIEFNKITNKKYDQLNSDYEFDENGTYKKYEEPVELDGNVIRNVGDPVLLTDAVNKKTLAESEGSVKEEIQQIKTELDNKIQNLKEHINSLVVYDSEKDELYISTDIIEI